MKLQDRRVLVTGGAGGLGTAIARALLQRGARVLLADRDRAALDSATTGLREAGQVDTLAVDLLHEPERARLCEYAVRWQGGIDVLINNAGVCPFGWLEDQPSAAIETALGVNVAAPIDLCRQLLPHLRRQPAAQIVNIGSVIGLIGYPGYAVYAASKAALKAFSESLRRELHGSPVQVHFLAPRAARTGLNSSAVTRLNGELGNRMDPPETVAAAVCHLLESGQASGVVGWPEKLFVRVNALWPGLVDRAVARQLPTIERYARTPAAPLASIPVAPAERRT